MNAMSGIEPWVGLSALMIVLGIVPGALPQAGMRRAFGPPLATQQAIVAEIEAEQALVAANRQLITRFERKIQATLARVWGEDSAAPADNIVPLPAEAEPLSRVAEIPARYGS